MSELICDIMAYGIGAWSNTEEAEDYLTLDELVMLHERFSKHEFRLLKFQAAMQGVDLGNDEEASDDEELPPEILEMERAWQEKKAQAFESGEAQAEELKTFGLGYTKKS